MTGPTMTCDPDLDSAITEFRYVAQRLRTLDQQMLTAAVDRYKHFAAIKHERAELWANLRGKAEKLQLVPEDHHLAPARCCWSPRSRGSSMPATAASRPRQ